MKIAVGSTNPVKIQAICQVATRVWPEADIRQIAAESGISSMPLSSEETLRGASRVYLEVGRTVWRPATAF